MARQIEIPDPITVGALADTLDLPVTKLIGELFKGGIMATVNEKIDFDTASILVGDLELDVELVPQEKAVAIQPKKEYEISDKAVSRPPVVAVMGHVDHGKTSLLDAIRQSDVVSREAGGITQHISAYQIKHGERLVTFLDTPGHEAFAALREHGAHLTDVAIIVVAADDGIKPQTLEAIRFARKAGVKIVVAINKIDKEAANPAMVKQQLAENDLLLEEWGGDTVAVEVSAKTKQGLDKLIDMVLLVADVEDLKADTDIPGQGLIIESHMQQGRGPIATALVQQGTLSKNDFIVAGSTYAKVRVLEDSNAKQQIPSAGPSTPVQIIGFKALPQFGDAFHVVKDEKTAKSESSGAVSRAASSLDMTSSELTRIMNRRTAVTELNIILKADVQGSLTSLIDSVKTFDNDEVTVRIVGSGVGAITESDVMMADTSDAIIYGFHVDIAQNIRSLANRDKVQVRLYRVIYELLDDVKAELETLLSPEVVETDLGRLVVKGVFKITKSEVICGGEVTKGVLRVPSMARVLREGKELAEVEIINLKQGPQETKEVQTGEMCGLSFKSESRVEVQEGDHIELFTREIRTRSL